MFLAIGEIKLLLFEKLIKDLTIALVYSDHKSSLNRNLPERPERGLTGVKTKFYWEEMLEAVQVAHQVSALKRNLTYGFGATHVAFLVCRSESFNKK